MCEVQIKDESSDAESDDGPSSSKLSCIESTTKPIKTNGTHFLSTTSSEDMPSLSINNVAATYDTLRSLQNGQISISTTKQSKRKAEADSYDCSTISNGATRIFLEMQNKEHALRMEILQVQLQTAKFNREAAEINKMIAFRNYSANNSFDAVNGTEH